MDRHEILAAFDEQVRRRGVLDLPGGYVERDARVTRCGSADGWTGVSWSELDPTSADAVIAAQVRRFTALGRPWEWKHYSHDRPADLTGRLRAAGFVAQPSETFLVAEVGAVACRAAPHGVQVRDVVDRDGVEALVSVHDAVFGGDHSAMGRSVVAALAHQPAPVVAMVAWARRTPVAAGRIEFFPGTDFAGLFGGGTLPQWRRRGVFGALVARRAALAARRGVRYLAVDASAASRPMLRRLGFVELATTTPFVHPGVDGMN